MTYYVSRLLLAFFCTTFWPIRVQERTLALASKATGQKENPLLHTAYFLQCAIISLIALISQEKQMRSDIQLNIRCVRAHIEAKKVC